MIAGDTPRAARAMELRRSGMSYAEIARTMGWHKDSSQPITASAARLLVKKRERYERIRSQDLGALRERVRGVLRRAGIQTVNDLCKWTVPDLLALRYFGRGALAEVEALLRQRGRKLAGRQTPRVPLVDLGELPSTALIAAVWHLSATVHTVKPRPIFHMVI